MNTISKRKSAGVNVGIDVGKSQLDICIHERGLYFSVENTPAGVRQALGRLSRYRVDCFATHMLEDGVNIRTVRTLPGHKDVKTTEIYTHVMDKSFSGVTSPLLTLGGRRSG